MKLNANGLRALLFLVLTIALRASAVTESPLVIGTTLVLPSKVLGETRRINVHVPTRYGVPIEGPMPVIYMPDGGINEDFLHIAGLLDVSVVNGTVRPHILVGIENTERARDMTGPTTDPRDTERTDNVGQSAAFRRFLAEELIPLIDNRYATTDERVLIGESLAGLFVVETLLAQPALFDTYIAMDPSVWWNFNGLGKTAAERLAKLPPGQRALFVATSREATGAESIELLLSALRKAAPSDLAWHHEPMTNESHATLYHPAALLAFRRLLAPAQSQPDP